MSKALFDFMAPSISVANLQNLGSDVVTSMTDNPNFPDAAPLVATVATNLSAFEQSSTVAKKGSEAQKLVAAIAKTTFQISLKGLCKHVNSVTEDRVLLLTTGFNLSKEGRTLIVLSAITNLLVEQGTATGTFKAGFKRVEGMQSAGFQWGVGNEPEEWNTVYIGNRCSTTIEGVTPGVAVSVIAFIDGPRSQRVYSQPVIAYAGFSSNIHRS